ncbi:MAG: VCBS repeat-containing protein, partial [Pirellulaceae bacterium]|nr:VCBS repeat-containing protein [Pirellulaceae bacterium]
MSLGNGDGSFTAQPYFTTGGSVNRVVVGDFNEDNKQDVAFITHDSNAVTIHWGNGLGGFSGSSALGLGARNGFDLLACDLNVDGHLDLAVVMNDLGNVKMFLGAGNGTFTLAPNTLTIPAGRGIQTGDFNEDGLPDLAVVSDPASVYVFIASGGATFLLGQVFPAVSGAQMLDVGDFDQDGHLDIAVGKSDGTDVALLNGNGLGAFATPRLVASGATGVGVLRVADFDRDGLPDLVATSGPPLPGASVLLNAGDVAEVVVTVENAPPTIDSVTNNGPVEEGSPVTVTIHATDPAGDRDPLTYEWDFDNNSVYEVSSSDASAQHIFPDSGTYTVTVRVSDDDGGTATDTIVVTVTNVAPTFDNVQITSPIDEGDTATLTGSIVDPGTLDTFTLEIDWGDPLSPGNTQIVVLGSVAIEDGGVVWNPATRQFALDHQYLDDNPSNTVQDEYTVTLSLSTLDPLSRWSAEGNALDSFDGNHGTVLGGVNYVAGHAGQAFDFDGSTGRVDMGNPASLNFGTSDPFSLEAWFNWSGAGWYVHNIVRKTHYATGGDGYWLRINRDNSVVEFYVGEAFGEEPRGLITTPITTNQWYHVVGVRDAAGEMSLYLNGELKGTDSAPGANATGSGNFLIGAWYYWSSVYECFSGMIDEVSVYDRALTANEVQILYEGGAAATVAVTVQDKPPVVDAGENLAVEEGDELHFSATFTDVGILDTHTATIDWGDGTVESGIVAYPAPDVVLPLVNATATFEQTNYGDVNRIATSIDGFYDGSNGWALYPQQGSAQTAVFQTSTPITGMSEFVCDQYFYQFSAGHKIQKFRLSVTGDPNPTVSSGATWTQLAPSEVTAWWAAGTLTAAVHADNTVLVSGLSETPGGQQARWTVRAPNILPSVTGFRLEVFPVDDDGNGYATVGFQAGGNNGNIVLTEFTATGIPTPGISVNGTVAGSHVYADAGTYTLTVTVTDDDGGADTSSTLVKVAESPSLVVTTSLDVVDAYDGLTSLREALAYANSHAGADTVAFNDSLMGATIVLVQGQLDVSDSIGTTTIQGLGADRLTIDGNRASRIFYVHHGVSAIVSGLTVKNGSVAGDGWQNSGGAIFNDGVLTVSDCEFADNFSGGMGGAIYKYTSDTLIVDNCVFRRNSADYGGGAIGSAYYGTIRITGSTFSENIAGRLNPDGSTSDGYGGGFLNNYLVNAEVSNSAFIGNRAFYYGGGIGNAEGNLIVTNSTFVGNVGGTQGGGAIRTGQNGGTFTATNCTITQNEASHGGGIWVHNSTADLYNTIVAGNTNTGGTSPDIYGPVWASFSLIQNTTGGTVSGTSNILGQAPLLAPMGSYGGPTQTMALLPGSPAIDAADSSAAPITDQRGVSRVGAADIGAFESRGFTAAIVSGAGQSAPVNTAFAESLVVTVSSDYGEPVANGLVTFTSPASGASAVLSGTPATIGDDGRASVSATANAIPGSYAVEVREGGIAEAVGVPLTNFKILSNVAVTTPISEGDTARVTGTINDPGEDSWTVTVDFGDGTPPEQIPITRGGSNGDGLSEGLIGYWPFDGSGSDASGGNRDLSLYGGVGFATGLFGQAMDLHGNTTQFAQRPQDDDIFDFGSSDFTVQIWVNFNQAGGEQTLIEKFYGGGGPSWTLTKPGSGFHFYAPWSAVFYTGYQPIPTQVWHQVVVRRSGIDFDICYDGTSIAWTQNAGSLVDTDFPLLIGKRNDADGRGFAVDGRIDETAIWDRALTNNEIAALFNGGTGRQVVPPANFEMEHVYADDGVYTVTVTVADDDGGTSSEMIVVTVQNAAPVIAPIPAQRAFEGALVQLPSVTFTDPGVEDEHVATIDWGDGTVEPVTVVPPSGGEPGRITGSHVYADNGTYKVTVSVQDDDMGSADPDWWVESFFDVFVDNVLPSDVEVQLSDTTVVAGATLTLSGTFADPGILDTHRVTVYWGDGSSSTVDLAAGIYEFSVDHQYPDNPPGTTVVDFPISVSVIDKDFLPPVSGPPSVSNFEFSQLSWYDAGADTAKFPYSSWGMFQVDVVGDPSQTMYLNVAANAGNETVWIVKNMPIFADLTNQGGDFDIALLGVPAGTQLTTLDFVATVSAKLQTDMPTGAMTTATVESVNHHPAGDAKLNQPALPDDVGSPAGIMISTAISNLIEHEGVPGVQEGTNQCLAGATARSIAWLNARYNLGSTKTPQQIYQDMEALNNSTATYGDFLKQKAAYLRNLAAGAGSTAETKILKVDVEVGNPEGVGQETGADVKQWIRTELNRGEDVELDFDTHIITVTGTYDSGGQTFLKYRDDEHQGNDDKGDSGTKMGELTKDANGDWQFRPAGSNTFYKVRLAMSESVYKAVVTVKSLPDVLRFDFNSPGSPTQTPVPADPLAENYIGVLPTDLFTLSAGFGWVTSPSSFDRGAISSPLYSPLLRDGAWQSSARDFRMYLEPGDYEVTVVFGDASFTRDRMNVTLVGGDGGNLLPVTNVATAAGQFVHRTFTAATEDDGELTLRFSDGGGDPYWAVASVEARRIVTPFDVTIVGEAGSRAADGTSLDTFSVTGATAGAVYTLSTTHGSIDAADADSRFAGIQIVAPAANFSFDVRRGTVAGEATVQVDEVCGASRGSTPQVYSLPAVRRFDFDGSPVQTQSGFTSVRGGTLYSAGNGFGWTAAVNEFVRDDGGISQPGLASLYRDGHWNSGSGTFQIQVAKNGVYDVRVYTGDRSFARDQLWIDVEGAATKTVSTAANEFKAITIGGVDVDGNGILTVTIGDGGGDPYWTVNGIEIAAAGQLTPDVSIAVNPASAPEMDAATVTFTVSIPGARNYPISVDYAVGGTATLGEDWQLTGDYQTATGTITFAPGDIAKTITVQVANNSGGTEPDETVIVTLSDPVDGYLAAASSATHVIEGLAPLPWRFDFNTSSSPTAPGYLGVGATNAYDAALGYGWQSTASTFSRGISDPLLTDGHWGTSNTFLVDVPVGQYVVNVTLGDASFARNYLDIYVEGVKLLDDLSSAAGQFTTASTGILVDHGGTLTIEGVTVTDGQLNIGIVSSGGDPYFAVNAIEVWSVRSMGLHTLDEGDGNTIEGTGATPNAFVTVSTTLGSIPVAQDKDPLRTGVQVQAKNDGTFTFEFTPPAGGTAVFRSSEIDGARMGQMSVDFAVANARRFDFNGSANNTQVYDDDRLDFTGVRGNQLYNASDGFGWTQAVSEFQRASAAKTSVALYRDGHWGSAVRTFQVAVNPLQNYNVRVYVGDASFARDKIQASIDGVNWVTMDPVSIGANVFATILMENIDPDAPVMSIMIRDAGGDPYWVVNGMDVWSGSNDPGVANLLAATQSTEAVGEPLSQAAVDAVLPVARQYWISTGLADWQVAELYRTPVSIGDLSYRGALGVSKPEGIWLDASGAG